RARDPENGEAARDHALSGKIVERGHQLPAREVSGAAENNHGARLRAAIHPPAVSQWVLFHNRDCDWLLTNDIRQVTYQSLVIRHWPRRSMILCATLSAVNPKFFMIVS